MGYDKTNDTRTHAVCNITLQKKAVPLHKHTEQKQQKHSIKKSKHAVY